MIRPSAHELAEARAHEQRVAAFLASVPKRRRERAEARYEVLEGRELRRVLQAECCWEGDVLDTLPLIGGDNFSLARWPHRTTLKELPGYEQPA